MPIYAARTPFAAHTPTLLVRAEAKQVRQAGMRFYISVGGNHGRVLRRWSTQFAYELSSLHLSHDLRLLPPSERGRSDARASR